MVRFQLLYIAVFSGTALLSLVLGWVMWRQRQAFQATAVVALMLGVAVWCAAEAALWWAPTLFLQVAMIRITYVGAAIVIAAYAVFALQIAQVTSWLTRRRIMYVCALPALLGTVSVVNPGGLVEAGYFSETLGSYTHYGVQYGPLLWAYIVVNGIIMLASCGLVARAFFRSAGVQRAQSGLVLIGSLVPLVVGVVNQLSFYPVEGLEAASCFFTGVFYVFAIARGTVVDESGRLVTAATLSEAAGVTDMLDAANVFLIGELEAAQLRERSLYEQATRDPLTGLYNRRAMNEYLAREMARFARTQEPVALLMLDVDRLKLLNDSLSHSAGDAALVAVAETLLVGARSVDVVCRFGGDEFVIIMSGADAEAAYRRAEELRERVGELAVGEQESVMPLSLSIGVAMAPADGVTAVDLMVAADRALHAAKEAGRDQVAVGVKG
jgi:diguanylate cyclase (GGDEF)-like protein